MASLQGPVVCPAVRTKQTGVYSLPLNRPLMKTKLVGNGFWGSKKINNGSINVGIQHRSQKGMVVRCSFSSSSNDNGSTAENFNENDADYVNSSVVEAGTNLCLCNYSHFL